MKSPSVVQTSRIFGQIVMLEMCGEWRIVVRAEEGCEGEDRCFVCESRRQRLHGLGEAKVFHDPVVESSRAHDLLFFLLAEYPPDIISTNRSQH